MENVAGEQGLALQRIFPYKYSYCLKNPDCHKFSCFNGGDILVFLMRFFHLTAAANRLLASPISFPQLRSP